MHHMYEPAAITVTATGGIYGEVFMLAQSFPAKHRKDAHIVKKETNSEIIFPRIYPLNRKEGMPDSKELVLIIKTSKDIHYLQLRSVEDSNLFKASHSESSFHESNNSCRRFTGKFLTDVEGEAAVSVCGPRQLLSGIILKGNHSYIIRPLFSEEQWGPVSSERKGFIPHILYRPNNEYTTFHGMDTTKYDEKRSHHHDRRVRRADSNGKKVIETAVYVDYPLYQKLSASQVDGSVMSKIRNAVLAIVNEVQLIYNYNSLRTKFKIVVVKLEVLSENKEAPDPADGDIDQYLDNFCVWQSLQNPPVSSKEHWDHALMLTGLNLHKTTSGGTRNEKVLGLAWVNGMCRPQHSCTLNEGSSFEAAFVIAHEMGHSLGMLHDGRGNDCDPNTFLMSEKTGPGKITWSTCSNEYLDKFFEKGYGACLEDDNTPTEEILDHEGELPGHRFSLDDQCKMSLGENFKPHVVPKPPFDDVCRELWCVSGLWASVAHPALEGSACGSRKYCHQGACKRMESSSSLDTSKKEMASDMKGTVANFLDHLRSAFKILAA